jgi:hypothetical protein
VLLFMASEEKLREEILDRVKQIYEIREKK